MKAIVYEKYGTPDVLELREIDKPTPIADQLLIKIEAAGVNAADKHLLTGTPLLGRFEFGLRKPKRPVLGADVAGVVEAVGPDVKQFEVGDAVFGDLSGAGLGGFAEYVCATEQVFVQKSADMSFETAAALPMAAVTALQALQKAQLQAGQRVLVNGASGGVGTFAVQIAKALGAEVTAVCSTGKMEMVRSLGADDVIDYTRDDFARNGKQYDVILGVNGDRPISDYRRALTSTGTYIAIGGGMKQLFQALLLGPLFSKTSQQTIGSLLATPNQQDLTTIKQMVDAGQVTPVIAQRFTLSELPAALRIMQQGNAKGKLIITGNTDANR